MKRISVLHIGKYYPPYVGGTESQLVTLVGELKNKLKIEVLVSNVRFKTSVEKIDGVRIYRLASAGKIFSLPLTLTLPFWMKRKRADILHFHLPNPLSVISYFISRPKGKIIVSYHNDIVRQRFFACLFNPLLIRFLRKADTIVVASANLVSNSSILRRFKDKCRVIPYGIDNDRFAPEKKVLKKAKNIKEIYGPPLILFVGRIVYYKGLEYLLRAMKNVEAKLLIVGDGPLRKRLEKSTQRLEISDKVFWLGMIDDKEIASYYYACDIFVLPSSERAESFGIVQLEAFACRKPVVSTNLPTGVPDVNINYKTGLVVLPRDPCDLTGAINRLLSSSKLRRVYGRNGRNRVKREFTKERMADAVFNTYLSSINYKV